MPLNSLYAVWAIVFSIALTGLDPTPQLVIGVLVTFGGALLVVSGAPHARTGEPASASEAEAISPPAVR
jgi:drug/metabolite transporter (DMT)-like permease